MGSSKYGVHEGRSDGLSGQDSLLSIVQMRAGVPVATDAIDGAKNAGLLGAPIVGAGNPRVLDRVARFKRNLEAMVLKKVEKMARGELT